MRLVACDRLDPRPQDEAAERPIAGAVNIPFAEIEARMAELPPRGTRLDVVGPEALGRQTVELLARSGRFEARYAGGESGAPAACISASEGDGSQLADAIGRLWRPNSFLEATMPGIPAGSVLDIACGSGRDAVFMADAGWRVTGMDVLPDAIEMARALERRYVRLGRAIEWRVCDVESPSAKLGGPYDLVTCFRFLHRPLFRDLHRIIRPGGLLLVETFTEMHRERHGKPARDAYVLKCGELPELLSGLKIEQYEESWRDGCHAARAWAIRE